MKRLLVANLKARLSSGKNAGVEKRKRKLYTLQCTRKKTNLDSNIV